LDALQLIQVSHDEIVASVLQQLFLEMLRRMQVLARRVGALTATLQTSVTAKFYVGLVTAQAVGISFRVCQRQQTSAIPAPRQPHFRPFHCL